MKKKTLIATLVILLIGFISLLVSLYNYKNDVNAIEFDDIDLSTVSDGNYKGSYDTTFVKVEVEVFVKDNKIIKIDLLKHENGRGKSAETVVDEIISKQSTDIDYVTGATVSSKVIRKAVENALLLK